MNKLLNLRLFCVIISLILLLNIQILTVKAANTTYYVSPTGNDLNIGTQQNLPFKTIYKASQVAVAGDTIIIGAGEYRETVTPKNSGTQAAPITYKAELGAKVVINGCDIISNQFTQHSNNIYKTNVTLPLGDGNQIFVNQNMMIDARWPNQNSDAGDTSWLLEPTLSPAINGLELSKTVNGDYYYDYRFSIQQNDNINTLLCNPTGGKIWVAAYKHFGWCAYTGDVTAFNSSNKTITFDTKKFAKGWEKCSVADSTKDCDYYLFGKLDYLDEDKEYYYDTVTNTLYLWQPNGGVPVGVEYKARKYGFDLREKSYINIENIDLLASTIETSQASTVITINNMKANYISHFSTAECNIGSRTSDTGFILNGTNNQIINCDIKYSAGNGVLLSGNNNKAINNTISDCNYLGVYAANVQLKGRINIISYNTITRSGRSGLTGQSYGCKITNNEISRVNMLSADGGCIYLGYSDGANTEIAYNKLYDHYGSQRLGTGLYLDSYSSNYIIHHNYTDGLYLNDNYDDGFYNNDTRANIVIVNNTVYGRGFSTPVRNNVNDYKSDLGFFVLNNIFTPKHDLLFGTKLPPMYYSMNWVENKHGDPLLNIDGTLSENSLCRDYDSVLKYEYFNENVIDGKTDIGAFEYGVPSWKCGKQSVAPQVEYNTVSSPLINMVKNAGFDTGEDLVWQFLSGAVKKSSGGKVGNNAVTLPNSSAKAKQTITGLLPNQEYEIAGFSQVQSSGGKPIMRVEGNGLTVATVQGSEAVQTGKIYTHSKVTFKTGNDTNVIISLENAGTAAVCWDSISLNVVLSSPMLIPEIDFWGLIENGGFEEEKASWYDLNYSTVTTTSVIDTSILNSGKSSIKVIRNGHNSTIGQLISGITTNEVYDFTAYVKASTPMLGFKAKFSLSVTYTDGSKEYPIYGEVELLDANWKKLSYQYTNNSTKTITNVQISVTTAGTGVTDYNYYLDDISVKKLSKLTVTYKNGEPIGQTTGLSEPAVSFDALNGTTSVGVTKTGYTTTDKVFSEVEAPSYIQLKANSTANKILVMADFGGMVNVKGINIRTKYGKTSKCEIYLSETYDGIQTATPIIATLTQNTSDTTITASFPAITAHFIKIVFYESYGGQFSLHGISFTKIYIESENSQPLLMKISDENNSILAQSLNNTFDSNGGLKVVFFLPYDTIKQKLFLELDGGGFSNYKKQFSLNQSATKDLDIKSFTFKDENNGYFIAGSNFLKASVQVKNNTNIAQNISLLYFLYNNNRLVDAFVGNEASLIPYSEGNVSVDISIPQAYDNLKLYGFIWNSLTTLRPLALKFTLFEEDNVVISIE